jgi:cobalt/nickel transport system permease protein
MHISEGVLSAPVLLSGGILTAAGTFLGLRRLTSETVMPAALMSSVFFTASLVHVPLGPGSVHLVLNGLVGLVLGWACFPALLVALFLQAIFFQFGGLTVLGVNTLTVALPALICHYLARSSMDNKGVSRAVFAFLAGALSILLTSLLMALFLTLSDTGFMSTAKLILVAHIPLMLIEGCITLFAVSFLARVQPEILQPRTVP